MSRNRACLLLHGFTGGPYEVEPLARHLRACGWHCVAPTLPGHGESLRALKNVRYADWLAAASAAAESLIARTGPIDVVGFSMGGLLAAHIANRYPVRRVALLNAAVYYISPMRFLRNAARQVRSDGWKGLRIKRETPPSAILEFAKLVRAVRPELYRVAQPTFIAQSEQDEIVHPRSAQYIYRAVRGEKEAVLYPNSLHMICGGPDAGLLFAHIERFFAKGDD
ncbi:alpha/beta hydrolase [Paenibacillus sp.]|uniref:alpha/beta hydrolase n=1 Tax=Paenibacillus sp. TaxID=58172 RepID=UPI002D45AFDF|nr:alpha/beta fold hydrolase [Paenibacillus sp.]HZG85292.1 alpha/beta fold hydrolase [Paenibacillus sp.]